MKTSYKIIYKNEAKKFLKINKIYGLKFLVVFEEISKDYLTVRNYDIKKVNKDKYIKNDYTYRLRIGGYRAIFELQDEIKIIAVIKIGSRGDIYNE